MKKSLIVILIVLVCILIVFLLLFLFPKPITGKNYKMSPKQTIKLPAPEREGSLSVEEALQKRRSVRNYKNESLNLREAAQLLWAAQGITNARGHRTAPSAGATFPMKAYLVSSNTEGLEPGIYKYNPHKNTLSLLVEGDKRTELAKAALGQRCVESGAVSIVLTAVYERTTSVYGRRGMRYVDMEAGHIGQNISLQAVSLGLGAVTVGAFKDEELKKILDLPEDEEPLYIIPVGRL